MFKVPEVGSLLEVYEVFGKALLEHGQVVQPRGQETKELVGVSFCITDPTQRSAYFPSRNFNTAFAVVESLMLLLPYNKVEYFSHFNKNVAQFSDDGKSFYGSYGNRIAYHIPHLIQKLSDTPDTRQAILTIHKVGDSFADTKDVPCTISLHFMIREGKLNLHVTMRSNDIIWGLPYDVFNFTMLQEAIAKELQIEVGKYYHTTSSLHVYSRHYELLGQMLFEIKEGVAESTSFPCDKYSKQFNKAIAYTEIIDSGRADHSKSKFLEWVKSC